MAIRGQQIGTIGGAALSYGLNFLTPGLGALLGGAIGGLFDDNDAIQENIQNALKQYEGIVPPDLAKAIVYTQYQQGGKLTPEQLSKLPEEAQQIALLHENPEMRQKQMVQQQAMEQLAQTGMGAQERFALEQTRLKAAQDAQARMRGLAQQYQQMGQAGGGAQLAAQLSGLQESAQSEMLANMQAAAMAAENRRNAITQAMQGATQMRQQDLGVEESNIQAQRQKQMFDIQNSMARQRMNAEMAQQANMMNLQRQQQIMDMNAQMANQEIYRQQYLAPQLMYKNAMDMANAKAGVYTGSAKALQEQSAAQGQGWNTLVGAGIGYLDKLQGKQAEGKVYQPPVGPAQSKIFQPPQQQLNFNNAYNPQRLNYDNIYQQQTPMGYGGMQAGDLNYGMQPMNYNPYFTVG
jgi:hypothetical protein